MATRGKAKWLKYFANREQPWQFESQFPIKAVSLADSSRKITFPPYSRVEVVSSVPSQGIHKLTYEQYGAGKVIAFLDGQGPFLIPLSAVPKPNSNPWDRIHTKTLLGYCNLERNLTKEELKEILGENFPLDTVGKVKSNAKSMRAGKVLGEVTIPYVLECRSIRFPRTANFPMIDLYLDNNPVSCKFGRGGSTSLMSLLKNANIESPFLKSLIPRHRQSFLSMLWERYFGPFTYEQTKINGYLEKSLDRKAKKLLDKGGFSEEERSVIDKHWPSSVTSLLLRIIAKELQNEKKEIRKIISSKGVKQVRINPQRWTEGTVQVDSVIDTSVDDSTWDVHIVSNKSPVSDITAQQGTITFFVVEDQTSEIIHQ